MLIVVLGLQSSEFRARCGGCGGFRTFRVFGSGLKLSYEKKTLAVEMYFGFCGGARCRPV